MGPGSDSIAAAIFLAIVGLICYLQYRNRQEDRAAVKKWAGENGFVYDGKAQPCPAELKCFSFIRSAGDYFNGYVPGEDGLMLSGAVIADGGVKQMARKAGFIAFEYQWMLHGGGNHAGTVFTKWVVAANVRAPKDVGFTEGEVVGGAVPTELERYLVKHAPKGFEWQGEWMVVTSNSSMPIWALREAYSFLTAAVDVVRQHWGEEPGILDVRAQLLNDSSTRTAEPDVFLSREE